MYRLIKLFFDIALLRKSPAAVPASGFLLALTCIALGGVEIAASFLPRSGQGSLMARILVAVGLPLAWTWVVLSLGGRSARFLQAATAFAAVLTIGGIILYPLNAFASSFAESDPRYSVFAFAVLTLLTWQLIACGGIWRAALEIGWMLAIGLAVAYVPVEMYASKLLLLGP
jgi:hypothetical protein